MDTLEQNMAGLDDLFEDGLSVDEVFEVCCENWANDDPVFAAVMGY